VKNACLIILPAILLTCSLAKPIRAQGGNILFGDVRVEEGKGREAKGTNLRPISVEIMLYNLSGYILARATVGNNGRYRFIDLLDGEYDLVVSIENSEVSRIRVQLRSPVVKTDFRQDITLEWRSLDERSAKPASVSVEDYYKRSSVNQKRFDSARVAINNKKYDAAESLLKKLLSEDANDFQACTELGTVYLFQQDSVKAEQAYSEALAMRPRFFLALMNLGRLRLLQKKFEGAISVLSEAVAVRATSAEANYFLGEAYLQIKKGSKAVPYLYEALKLDPIGKADAHLRLGALYNAAGMKDKAAAEYAEFLRKRPDDPGKQKLQEYIKANKKP
jgi:tetratricopeptide (TPR) repeat protein